MMNKIKGIERTINILQAEEAQSEIKKLNSYKIGESNDEDPLGAVLMKYKHLESADINKVLTKVRLKQDLTPDDLKLLVEIKTANEFNNNNPSFYQRFSDMTKHYEHQRDSYRGGSDYVITSSRSVAQAMDAYSEYDSTEANKEQNTTQANVSLNENKFRLYNSYIENRQKSKDNMVDQLLQLIFQLMQEIGSLSRA